MTLPSNVSTESAYVLPFDETGIIVIYATVYSLCVFGIIANLTVIIVISASKKLKSPFFLIMLSLSVSDLVSALISPLFVYRNTWGHQYWELTDFLCKVFWGLDITTSYSTSLHILLFALLRFVSIQWLNKFNAFTLKKTQIAILVVWTISIAAGFVPYSVWYGAFKRSRKPGSRDINWSSCDLDTTSLKEFDWYTIFSYALFFYIPIFLVIVLSFGFCLKIFLLQKKRIKMKGRTKRFDAAEKKRQAKESRMMLQLGLIVSSYLVGFIPMTVYHFINLYQEPNNENASAKWWFQVASYVALRLSECLDPVFYNASSWEMLKETKATFKNIWDKIVMKKKQFVKSISSSSTI